MIYGLRELDITSENGMLPITNRFHADDEQLFNKRLQNVIIGSVGVLLILIIDK